MVETARLSPRDNQDSVFDVILADFGRESTLRLLREVAVTERQIVARRLRSTTRKGETGFFDEYRRIMFACIGDIRYVKRDIIREYAASHLRLDASVLFGVRGRDVSAGTVASIVDLLIDPVRAAVTRGHHRIRVVLPCNTLGRVEQAIAHELASRLDESVRVSVGQDPGSGPVGVQVIGVPRVVIEHVLNTSGSAKLMLVGTELARAVYRDLLSEMGAHAVEVVDCSAAEQREMDRLLAACIGGDKAEIAEATRRLERRVIEPRRDEFGGSLVVVEASTDLDLGIGANSLRLFARHLVEDVYGAE